jgi:hypothetical protein
MKFRQLQDLDSLVIQTMKVYNISHDTCELNNYILSGKVRRYEERRKGYGI